MRRGHAYLVRSASGAHLIGNYATFPAARARSAMRADARNEHRLRLHISRAGPKFRKLRAAPSAMPARPIFHAPDSPPPHTLFHSLVLLLFPPYPPFFFPSHGAFRAGNPRHVYRDIIQIYVRGLYSPPQRRRGIISRFSLSLSLSRSLARSLACSHSSQGEKYRADDIFRAGTLRRTSSGRNLANHKMPGTYRRARTHPHTSRGFKLDHIINSLPGRLVAAFCMHRVARHLAGLLVCRCRFLLGAPVYQF